MRLENSPSKVAATEKPFSHFASAPAETSAEFCAGDAPNTAKPAAGIVWNSAEMFRSVLKLCAQAARPRSVTTASTAVNDVSPRKPSSVRDAALLSAGGEIRWASGFSVAGTFEGEFSRNVDSYAGKGIVRYQW